MHEDKILQLIQNLEAFVKDQTDIIRNLLGRTEVGSATSSVPVQPEGLVQVIHGKSVNPGQQFDNVLDAQISAKESEFGEEMSEAELEKAFGAAGRAQPVEQSKPLNKMSLDDIKSWEAQQNNSTDIYKIKARVSNLARETGGSLTGQGDILCNTYVHVLKSFYDFAEKIEDPTTRIRLIELIRSQEGMPGTVISAAGAGVKIARSRK
jgi:hypothetical protein